MSESKPKAANSDLLSAYLSKVQTTLWETGARINWVLTVQSVFSLAMISVATGVSDRSIGQCDACSVVSVASLWRVPFGGVFAHVSARSRAPRRATPANSHRHLSVTWPRSSIAFRHTNESARESWHSHDHRCVESQERQTRTGILGGQGLCDSPLSWTAPRGSGRGRLHACCHWGQPLGHPPRRGVRAVGRACNPLCSMTSGQSGARTPWTAYCPY